MSKRILVLASLSLFVLISPASAQEDLPQKARAVLETYCYRCHGEKGAVEGGVNYMLDRDQLIARRKVVPGHSAKSVLVKRILLDEMPPEGEKKPSAGELALLKKWIDGGANDFRPPAAARQFIAPKAMLDFIAADLDKMPNPSRRFARYFTITHLANAGLSEDELTTYRQAISKLANSLSWGRKITPPEPIDPARTIFRVDLRNYKWSQQTWEMLESLYPYGLLLGTEREKACQKSTGAQFFHMRGDWFVSVAALPPLYHEILRLPGTDRALEKELLVDVKNNLRDGLTLRAGFNGSGVSRNNRLIERHATLFGAYWKSYDFAGNTGRQNLFATPLGPDPRPNTFRHDGGEILFNLPNGLQAYMLVSADGRRIDKGPTEIVSDPRRPDRAVVNGLSCMSCHSRGIILKEDQVRPHVEKNRAAFSPEELPLILGLYAPQNKLREAMQEDAERLRKAVEKTGCRVTATEPIVALAGRFENEIGLALAAAELGMSAPELQKHFAKSVTLSRTLGPLAIEGGTVQRDVFTEAYAKLVRELDIGQAPPPQRRSDVAWSPTLRHSGGVPTWSPPNPIVFPRPTTPQPPEVQPKKLPPRVTMAGPSIAKGDPWGFHFGSHQSGRMQAVAISPRDRNVTALEGAIGVVTLFSDEQLFKHFGGHQGNILALDFAPSGSLLASGSTDQTARIWDVASGEERKKLSVHGGFVYSVRFSNDGRWLATGSERVRLWNVETGEEKFAADKAPSWVEGLAFSPNGRLLAAVSKSVQLWETDTGKLNAVLEGAGDALSIAFAPNGLLAQGSSDGTIHLWDVNTQKVVRVLKGHTQPVSSLVFSKNGKLLLSTGGDKSAGMKSIGEFKAWDPDTGAELLNQSGPGQALTCVAIAADGRHAATVGFDGHLRYRDLMPLGKVPLDPFEGHTHNILTTTLSTDGKVAVTSSIDRSVRVWDAQTGTQLQRFDGHARPPWYVLLSPDNQTLFSGGYDNTLLRWDLGSGKQVDRWDFPVLSDLHMSADRKKLIAEGSGRIQLWDVATKTKVRELEPKIPQRTLAISADGRKCAGALQLKGLKILDLETGQQTSPFEGSLPQISCAAFSADGKQLLTGDVNHYVCLWDLETGKELARYKGHTEPVQHVAFADNGRKILAAGGAERILDRTARFDVRAQPVGCRVIVWDAASTQELQRWEQRSMVKHLAVCDANRTAVFAVGKTLQKVTLP